jgi:hypothetical protein
VQGSGKHWFLQSWDLSYSRLEKEDPDAAKILKLLAYFDNQILWYELFHAGLTDCSPEWLREVITDDVNFNGVMGVLAGYFFLGSHQTSRSWSITGNIGAVKVVCRLFI